MNLNQQSALHVFTATMGKAGIPVPEALVNITDRAQHPRVQLDTHLAGIPTPQEAIAAALDAGKNPATDKTVQQALTAHQIRHNAGDLDTVQGRRIATAFTDHWDDIITAVDAAFTPAAAAFTRAHQILRAHRLDHQDIEGIRNIGGDAVTAWAAASTAEDTIRHTGTILSNAAITARPGLYGNLGRHYWTITPNLDTWIHGEPDTRNLWDVLDTGATLTLATTLDEAQQRAQLTNRERALAHEARTGAGTRGGFGGDDRPITYTGADGKQRTTTALGTIKPIEGIHYEISGQAELPENLVNL